MITNFINEIGGEIKASKTAKIIATIALIVMVALAVSIFIGLSQLN